MPLRPLAARASRNRRHDRPESRPLDQAASSARSARFGWSEPHSLEDHPLGPHDRDAVEDRDVDGSEQS